MKSLGATGGRRVRDLPHAGDGAGADRRACPGLCVGAALPFLIAWGFGAILPLPLAPALHVGRPRAGAALRPADRARLRAVAARPRARCSGLGAVSRRGGARAPPAAHAPTWWRRCWSARALAVLAVKLAYDQRIAAIFVAAAAAVFVLLRLVAVLLMAIARTAAAPALDRRLRLAIANIHRPGALTPSVVLSLGLGLALLVTVMEIDGNLRRQFMAALPDKAPAFYFVDIQSAEADSFDAFIARARAAARRSNACRCCADASWRPTASRPRDSSRRRTPPGRCRATAASPMRTRRRPGSRLVEGEWWTPDYQGPPLVSFEKRIADGLGLKVGDPVTVNVLGRNIDGAGRQPAHGRLAEPRHQFRHGVFAQRLPRRAAYPYRHPDLSGRQHARAGDRAAQGRGGRLSGRHHGAGARRHRRGRPSRRPTWCWRSAAPACSRCWSRRWCWAARSPPATAIGSMTP